MTGTITSADFNFKSNSVTITLEVNEKQEAMQLAEELKDMRCDIKITKHREKRSLNANSYAWSLIGQIAENQRLSKEEVYKHYVKNLGVYRQIQINKDAVETIKHSWSMNGLAWLTEVVDYSNDEDFVIMNLYYGSSTYNTRQMSSLIDAIVQDCKDLGIETKTPDEIDRLKSLWR